MLYMDDAVRATLELMNADAASIGERGSYNLAGISFTPSEMITEIRKHRADFEVVFKPDFRQEIAASWPNSIDDTCAQNEWGWKPRFDLAKIVEEMINNLSASLEQQ